MQVKNAWATYSKIGDLVNAQNTLKRVRDIAVYSADNSLIKSKFQYAKFLPFKLENKDTYIASNYLKPQTVISRNTLIPEDVNVLKGDYFTELLFELKGKLNEGVRVFTEKYKEQAGSINLGKVSANEKVFCDGNGSNNIGQEIYTVQNALNHQNIQTDYVTIPENVIAPEGQFIANKLLEIKGETSKGSTFECNVLEAYKSSKIADNIKVNGLATIEGKVLPKAEISARGMTIAKGAKYEGIATVKNVIDIYGEVAETAIITAGQCIRHEGAIIKGTIIETNPEPIRSRKIKTAEREEFEKKESQRKQQIEVEKLRLKDKKTKEKERKKLVSHSIAESINERKEELSNESPAQKFLREQQQEIRKIKNKESRRKNKAFLKGLVAAIEL